MLPESLLFLLSAALTFRLSLAQRTQLTVDDVSSFNTLRLPSPPSFSIPSNTSSSSSSPGRLAITIALCSSASPSPRFFVSNISDSDAQPDPGPAGGSNTWEIQLQNGYGNWTGVFPNGGVLAVDANGASEVAFDVGLSDGDPIHSTLTFLPLLGDTTSNQALLFSHPFLDLPPYQQPTYPNYTLPPAELPQPPLPASSSVPNMTLILTPTSSGLPSSNAARSACLLSNQASTGTIANQTLWVRDKHGWRVQWLVEGLTPSTNYTAYVVQDSSKISGPIYFATKSASFPCPLVHSLPYCPSVAYAVPLPSLSNSDGEGSTYDATTMPPNVTEPLLSYLTNFTTVITTFACGRDWYSPLVGCDDCQREYRKWLCSISFTRCSEPSPSNPNGFTAIPAASSATGLFATFASALSGSNSNSNSGQQPLSALIPVPTSVSSSNPRNPFLPTPSYAYTALLPCIEQCQAVDRACPPFIGFKCPLGHFNAAASYGVGYIDGITKTDGGDGLDGPGGGITGTHQDQFGNVWCGMV